MSTSKSFQTEIVVHLIGTEERIAVGRVKMVKDKDGEFYHFSNQTDDGIACSGILCAEFVDEHFGSEESASERHASNPATR
jgi:hypothetical protein